MSSVTQNVSFYEIEETKHTGSDYPEDMNTQSSRDGVCVRVPCVGVCSRAQ